MAAWQKKKIELIDNQFGVIESTCPGTTYNISLKKSEDARVNTYARLTDQGFSHKDASEHTDVAPNPKVKSFQAPIQVLREIAPYLGAGKDRQKCNTKRAG